MGLILCIHLTYCKICRWGTWSACSDCIFLTVIQPFWKHLFYADLCVVFCVSIGDVSLWAFVQTVEAMRNLRVQAQDPSCLTIRIIKWSKKTLCYGSNVLKVDFEEFWFLGCEYRAYLPYVPLTLSGAGRLANRLSPGGRVENVEHPSMFAMTCAWLAPTTWSTLDIWSLLPWLCADAHREGELISSPSSP